MLRFFSFALLFVFYISEVAQGAAKPLRSQSDLVAFFGELKAEDFNSIEGYNKFILVKNRIDDRDSRKFSPMKDTALKGLLYLGGRMVMLSLGIGAWESIGGNPNPPMTIDIFLGYNFLLLFTSNIFSFGILEHMISYDIEYFNACDPIHPIIIKKSLSGWIKSYSVEAKVKPQPQLTK